MLRLRAIEPEDVDLLYDAENEDLAIINGDTPAPYSRRILTEYAMTYDADPFRSGQLRLVATDDDETPIGLLDFYNISVRDRHAAIAILLLPKFRGQGLATPLIRAGIEYAFTRLGLSTLMALVHSDNLSSLRAFDTAGFTRVGTLHDWHFSDGLLKDVLIMQYQKPT